MSPSHPAEDQRVPTLTEVIDLPSAPSPNSWSEPAWQESAQPFVAESVPWVGAAPLANPSLPDWTGTPPASPPHWQGDAAAFGDERPTQSEPPNPALPADALLSLDLNQRILGNVQRQVDLMLDYRLREALMPTLARLADGLVRDLRVDLASTLQDVVARAVAQELARQRNR